MAGKASLQVASTSTSVTEDFYVVHEDVLIALSSALCKRLGLLKRMKTVEGTESSSIQYDPVKQYEDVFHGLRRVKDIIYSMKLELVSRGVVRLARKVSVVLRQRVQEELEKMEGDDIITKVEGSMEWSSSVVVVVKQNKVRICIDTVDLDKASLREYYPMKTLNNIVSKIG